MDSGLATGVRLAAFLCLFQVISWAILLLAVYALINNEAPDLASAIRKDNGGRELVSFRLAYLAARIAT